MQCCITVLQVSSHGKQCQAPVTHNDQASVILRADLWQWSLHLLTLPLRELNTKFLREEVAPYELQFCASFLTLVCKSHFFPPSPSDFALRHRWFVAPNSSIDMTCVLQETDFSGWAWECKHLFYFTSALAAFLATTDTNWWWTNKDLNTSFSFIRERRAI